jgi:hypothetical protein
MSIKPASLAGKQLTTVFHACAFFRSREEEYRVLAPFIAEGLAWGEKALYIVDPELREDRRRLVEAGVDLATHGAHFDVRTWEETYLSGGTFDADRMLSTVQATFAAAAAAGYTRLRIVGQMEWIHRGAPGTEQLLEYEVRCNEVLARERHPAVCSYQVDQLDASTMMDLLRAHPLAIIGGTLYENPFFTPPDQMLAELRARRNA